MEWLIAQWRRLPEAWRREIVSLSHTFVVTFAAGIYAEYTMGHILWSWTALIVICVSVGRSAWKAVINEALAWLKKRYPTL